MADTMKRQSPCVGDVVVYHDKYGKTYNALVKVSWDQDGQIENPCINLVYVSSDPKREDGAGRQTIVETSIVHGSSQTAHGFYWRRLDEEPNPYVAPSKD